MVNYPSHPERANRPAPTEWSHRNFWPWFAFMAAASVGGAVLTANAIPPNSDLFESKMLYLTIGVLAVLCGFAGWFAPSGGPYWGAFPTLPYFIAWAMGLMDHPTDDADLSIIGVPFLLFLLVIPWTTGFCTSLVRRDRR